MYRETNDGGCVNDKQLRDFTNSHAVLPGAPSCDSPGSEGAGCTAGGSTGSRYSQAAQGAEQFTYQLVNPAHGESVRGLQVLQQHVPFRMSTVQVINLFQSRRLRGHQH